MVLLKNGVEELCQTFSGECLPFPRSALRTLQYFALFPNDRPEVFVIDTFPADGRHFAPPASRDKPILISGQLPRYIANSLIDTGLVPASRQVSWNLPDAFRKTGWPGTGAFFGIDSSSGNKGRTKKPYLVTRMPPFLMQEDTIVITCDSVHLTVEMRDAISRMSRGECNVEEKP